MGKEGCEQPLPVCCPSVAANVSKALEKMTVLEQISSPQKHLEETQRETESYKQALHEALAKTHVLGFANASKGGKLFHFYTGISVEDFQNVLCIIGDSADNMNYCGVEDGGHNQLESRRPSRKFTEVDELLRQRVLHVKGF